MKIFLRTFFFFFISLFINTQFFSQIKSKSLNYSKHPYWIEMMNDPNVNYFEAIKAYDEFWTKHKKPTEENDIIGQEKSGSKKQTLLQKWFKSREERDEEEVRKYTLDVKKFEHWKMQVKPYVQADGHIISKEEQLKMWEQKQ